MSRRHAAAAAALGLTLCGAATPAFAGAGTGTVEDNLTATVVAGGLTLAGAGANVALSTTPGAFSPAAGATALTMTDTTGTTNGWTVTAQYFAPTTVGVIGLGGANIKVTASNVVPDATLAALLGPAGLSPAQNQDLSSPLAVMTTGAATGAGISTAAVGYQVRVPASAQLGQVYGGKVTYTIASVR